MGTPSKEEHKCDADVLPTELKSDDSLKENEMLSNGVDENNSVESSIGLEVGDSYGENDVNTSEELKCSNSSDRKETLQDISQNEKSNAVNISDDKQQSDAPITEEISSSFTLPESNFASSDSNLAMSSVENLSNHISEDLDLSVRDESQAENSAAPVYGVSKINEDKITPTNEIQEHDQDIDANNVIKEDNDVSTSASTEEFGSKSDVNTLPEDHNADDNVCCESSSEITSVSEETQKPNDLDNTMLKDGHESAETCQEVTESDVNRDDEVVENNEIKDTLESVKISEHNFDDTVVESACGKIPDVTEEKQDNEIAPCEEIQNHDYNSDDDDDVGKNVSEIKVISEEDSVNNSVTNKTISTCEQLQKSDHNSDDIVVQNVLNDSKTGEDSSEIEKIPEKRRGRKAKRKSCPKLKISISKKVDNLGSTSRSKNWYVSERKESTDSTQSEEKLMVDKSGSAKRGRKVATKSPLPESTLVEDERVCFETVAEIHAVDTDTNSSCAKVQLETNATSSEIVSDNALSDLVEDSSRVSNKMDTTSSVVLSSTDSATDTLVNETSSFPAELVKRRKRSCVKPSSDVLIKKEPIDDSAESVLEHPDVTVNIKLEDEEILKSVDEITVDATHLPSKRGRHSSAANKKIKFDLTTTDATEDDEEQKKATKKTSSKDVTDSPSEPSPKMPEIGTVYSVGKPASNARNRKKSYSTEAVIVPFSLGWMRELVHRATESKKGSKQSDVYYFSPDGIKLRSMIEISSYLSRHQESPLTMANFTFWKERVYRDPFERERSAKQKSTFGTPSGKKEISNQASIKKYLQSSTTPKDTSISAGNKNTPESSNTRKRAKSTSNSDGNVNPNKIAKNSKLPVKSPVTPSAKKKSLKSTNDISLMDTVENSDSAKPSRRVVKKVPFDNSFDDKPQLRPKRGRPSKSLDTSALESELTKTVNDSQSDNSKSTVAGNSTVSKTHSKATAPKRRHKLEISKNNTSGEFQPPCSPRCHIAAVQRPSVQCAICLCFFHPNCIPKLSEKVVFACKSCTTQKLALYEKESSLPCCASGPSLSPDDTISFDPNIDISLLSPEVILNVQTDPSASESDALSSIPQGLSGTLSSTSIKNVRPETLTSSPHLLSHLLQPTVQLTSHGLRPLAPKPTNQNLKSSTARVLLTKEAAAKMFPGIRLAPGTNFSTTTPFLVKRLPDGRRITLQRATSVASLNSSTLQKPVSNVNSNLQVLSSNSQQVNGNLMSRTINQSKAKASPNIVGNVLVQNISNFLSPGIATNSIRTSNLLTNARTGNSLKNFKLSSNSNASESGLSWDMSKLMTSCKSLLLVFKRLSIPDLLRVSQVCSYWKYVATQSDLWERISFQGLAVTDWERCCLALKKNATKALDLRGVVYQNSTNLWRDLEANVSHLAGIEELIFDQISPSLLKSVAYNMPLLRKLECHFVTTACSEPEIWTVPCEWELSSLRYMGRLVKLKIGSGSRIELKQGEDYVMPYLPQLRHVALTGFNFCSNVNLESLSKQKELISLELGDCREIEPGIYALLENLSNLKSLRLENGGSIDSCRLSEALIKIKGLEVLELMNFKICKKLSEAFKKLKHLIHLNVWPDNTQKAAVVNRNLFNAISSCRDLKYLCWGVIAEGEYIPQFLEMEDSNELTFENLFNDLVALFPEGRVEVKCAPRSSWREFCSTRK